HVLREVLAVLAGAAHGHAAHGLDTTGDHDVVLSGDDGRGGEGHGLLARSACPVDGGGGHGDRPSGREHGAARDDSGLVTHLADATPLDVVDRGGVDRKSTRRNSSHGKMTAALSSM